MDTSSARCAVALVQDGTPVSSRVESMSKGQAERLFPIIDAVLADAKCSYADLDAIAVSVGPGNFTGVRVCVSAARGLALSLEIPAIGVTVFEALAFGTSGTVTTSIDARGGMAYVQDFTDGAAISPPRIVRAETFESPYQCVGFLGTADAPEPDIFGRIALAKDWDNAPSPAPLYLREPDAALPAQAAPDIVP